MQVTDLKAILDYEHNEQWLAALNCYKGIWDHNPTDDVAIRYCFFCWYLIWQWEQIDFPGEDISFEAKITVDNRMGISKAELEHTLSSIACGYYNNFQIEYKCILVHLKRLIPYVNFDILDYVVPTLLKGQDYAFFAKLVFIIFLAIVTLCIYGIKSDLKSLQ